LFRPKKDQKRPSKVSKNGIDFIKGWEGLRLKAYRPVKGDVWTIGYGTTKGVKKGDIISPKTADELFEKDLEEFEQDVVSHVKIPLNQNQFDALVSLVYNIGITSFLKSKAFRSLNSGDLELFSRQAFDPQIGFVRSGGRILKGLQNRRAKERELFFTPPK